MATQSEFPELRSLFDKNREVIKMLKGEKKLTERQICFSTVYSRLGKKVAESKDKTSMTAFTTVINGRYKVLQPDTITITWHNYETDDKLFEHTFSVNRNRREDGDEEGSGGSPGFQGLGEVEVNNLVEKRLTEMRMKEEYERLREENQKMTVQIRDLEETRQTLEQDISAKETLENYLKIIGMALPGLSKILGGVGILNMLAGVEETPPGQAASLAAPEVPRDERQEMIGMLQDYMTDELDQQEVATLYLLFMEIQKDKSLIQKILGHLTTSAQ